MTRGGSRTSSGCNCDLRVDPSILVGDDRSTPLKNTVTNPVLWLDRVPGSSRKVFIYPNVLHLPGRFLGRTVPYVKIVFPWNPIGPCLPCPTVLVRILVSSLKRSLGVRLTCRPDTPKMSMVLSFSLSRSYGGRNGPCTVIGSIDDGVGLSERLGNTEVKGSGLEVGFPPRSFWSVRP